MIAVGVSAVLVQAALLQALAHPPAAHAALTRPPLGHAAAYVPEPRVLYNDGYDGRYLIGGSWLFRRDDADAGVRGRYFAQAATAGWSSITVPNAWNAGDDSARSMAGSVVWYRKDFVLPSPANDIHWIVRFESVRYRATVWLNGRRLGSHAGAYLPFELDLKNVDRTGLNRLVVRVDNRRRFSDLPPAATVAGQPTGGWWNYGGLLREVYLRSAVNVDYRSVMVRPVLPCPTCAARIEFTVALRNVTARPQRASVNASFGDLPVALGAGRIKPHGSRTFTAAVRVAQPQLWSPSDPHLYPVAIQATAGGAVAGYHLHVGIRSIRVTPSGQLLLNGRPLHLRGVAIHEDDLVLGGAVDNAWRAKMMGWVRDLGATVIRAHYPLHPELLELADQLGILVWSEIPMYQMNEGVMSQNGVRGAALEQLRENIVDNGNHASIFTWSVANELSATPGAVIDDYYRRAAALIHRLDPTRPAAVATLGYPLAGCQRAAYAPLDLIGVNDYFGWYPGPEGSVADPALLPGYLQMLHDCYRGKALMVTEYGAEANRDGPPEERGTYEFQAAFVDAQNQVFASLPWLSGAIYFSLQEFRVAPRWTGGNPRPSPPWHQKGLVSAAGVQKLAYFELRRLYHATQQIGP